MQSGLLHPAAPLPNAADKLGRSRPLIERARTGNVVDPRVLLLGWAAPVCLYLSSQVIPIVKLVAALPSSVKSSSWKGHAASSRCSLSPLHPQQTEKPSLGFKISDRQSAVSVWTLEAREASERARGLKIWPTGFFDFESWEPHAKGCERRAGSRLARRLRGRLAQDLRRVMPTESTPSRSAETPSKTPSRSTFRDLSNSVTKGVSNLLSWSTPTKPSAPATQAEAETPDSNGATPQPGAWQSADNFKFVEEDDDEVLFRVRDSGVLRSLTTPSFPSAGTEDTSSGEDIEAKQVHEPPRIASLLLFGCCSILICRIHRCSITITPCDSVNTTIPIILVSLLIHAKSILSSCIMVRMQQCACRLVFGRDRQLTILSFLPSTSGEGEGHAPVVHRGEATDVPRCPPRV